MKKKLPQPSRAANATTLHDVFNDAYANTAGPINIATILQIAKNQGIPITWRELQGLANLRRTGALVTPSFMTDFLIAYVATRQIKNALDPWAGIGSTLIPVVTACNISTATGISPSETDIEVARVMAGEAPIEWLHAKPTDALASLGEFDLVATYPPWGLPNQTLTIKEGKETVEVRDSGTHTLVLESARHLTKDGVGLFLLPSGFFFHQGKALVRNMLTKFGLYVNAVIALPAGTFSPYTGIPANIVVISRTKTTDLFVGQLTPGTDHKALLNNLNKRKAGGPVELGRLVRTDEFTSWQAVAAKEEEERLAQRSGLRAVQLNDAVTAVNLGKQTDDGGFENLPNCVYVPLIGTSPAVASLSDLRIKPQNYAQLVLRAEAAHAEFVAGFFNSPLGRKTRDAMLSGTFIPKLSKQTITEGTIYLLPLDAQEQATAVGREIQNLRLRLEQLERDLWNRPVDAAIVRKTLKVLNQKEGFESWLETLPFPLASILWRYQAAGSAEHKLTHLFNAFEAVAQFFGTLMASAFHSNAEFFRAHRGDWFDRGKDNPHSLSRSSFGEWVVRCQRLAKTTRQMLSDKDQRDLVLDFYGTDAAKVEGLTKKELYSVLETVGRYRNDWKGHTGIVSDKEHERRLGFLQEELTRLRGLLGGVFEDWWLIRPGKSSYTAGVFAYSAEKLMGSRQIFKQETLNTTEVMDANELYCYDNVSQRPLQLLHFVRMLAAPETEETACYFYNRIEKNSVRWVSYHFEKEAARVLADAAVLKIINEVEEDGAA
jgi:hypothetical protein